MLNWTFTVLRICVMDFSSVERSRTWFWSDLFFPDVCHVSYVCQLLLLLPLLRPYLCFWLHACISVNTCERANPKSPTLPPWIFPPPFLLSFSILFFMLQHLSAHLELHLSGPLEVDTETLNNHHVPFTFLQWYGFHLHWTDLVVRIKAHKHNVLYW